ncbi:hypothetical protein JK167_11915 [Levilactobacillus brevis]|uniref:Uncharacterized protein n=1 Tax=Levilactobacillus brevis TaxID=1580 RepID=A0A1W6NHA8_LEVBR|nr:DUF6096 family protein [Levilactobacillus brevis]ARN92883.1 hypothetical protein AZI11_08205 [Levilactobacillus brevis]ARN95527.1 hypothetical protein AZI12_08255 [Levilactobacillus brevis]MBS0948382.1 hypothetical protein [Levilactobacillus brevis]MBS0978671.1 hypothetical protein [Levilactobacillus brevis]MBS1011527.1 hypothetical protein [Levilactobacillus brevis]
MSTKTAGTTQFQLGNLSLDLKLDGKAILNIEKRLGKSVMALFMNANGAMQMPPTNEILIVLQGANQKHGVSDTDMIKAFQEYLDQGNSPMDLFVAISNLFEESGFFGSKTPTDDKQETLTLDNEDVEETEADDKTL